MPIQFDHSVRIVSLANLEAMAKRISGVCHRFTVSNVSANRVYVTYSNPDEYGNESPITCAFPRYAGGFNSVAVVLEYVGRITGAQGDSEAWQAFEQIKDCPQLWRDPNSGEWKTEYEIRVAEYPQFAVKSQWDKNGCLQTWFADGDATGFADYREAQKRAIELCKMHESELAKLAK